MNRTTKYAIPLVIIAIGTGAAVYYTQPDAVMDTLESAEIVQSEPQDEFSDAAENFQTGAEDLAEGIEETVEPEAPSLAEQIEDTAQSATDSVREAANAASTEAAEIAQGAEESARNAYDQTVSGIESLGADIANSSEQALDTASSQVMEIMPEGAQPETEAAPDLEEILTVDGYNYAQAVEAIREADITQATRDAALRTLDTVRDTPEQLSAALIELRDLLGLS